jgi:crossover junction endodeoxyribonuclease RuvC
MQNKERVLSIDPGFDRVGVAVLERTLGKEKLLFSLCILTNKKDSHAERLLAVGQGIDKVIKKWEPRDLAIEKLFFNQNTKSALGVAEARGVIIYEAINAGLSIYEYSPQEIKIATTGYGKASKKDVERMVLKILDLKNAPKHDDETDAIAVGITHLASYKQKGRLSP